MERVVCTLDRMKTKTFQPVPGPFGGTDEMKTQDAFVDFVGGTRRAEHLSRICQNSYPTPFPEGHPYFKTKQQVFRIAAKREGFTDAEVDAFLSL